MVRLSTTTRREGGVTLVECRLESERARRVRVANRLDGPVWPPRRRGVPAAGWDEDGVTVTVTGAVGLGYATPAPPADTPATIDGVEEPAAAVGTEAPDDSFATEFDVSPTAAGVVRSLSDPRPPRHAVPTGDDRRTDEAFRGGGRTASGDPRSADRTAAGTKPPRRTHRSDRDVAPTAEAATPDDGGSLIRSEASPSTGAAGSDNNADDPVPPDAWLRAVERRIELLEGVTAATTLPAATTAVAASGGLDGVANLAATVEKDRAALLGVARRAEALAGRATATEPDVATLRRLA